MDEYAITEEVLDWLESLDLQGDPGPWRSMVEGRDHTSGDTFIMVGREDDRSEDIYVHRDSGTAIPADMDLIAAARTYLPFLTAEIRALRQLSKSHRLTPE